MAFRLDLIPEPRCIGKQHAGYPLDPRRLAKPDVDSTRNEEFQSAPARNEKADRRAGFDDPHEIEMGTLACQVFIVLHPVLHDT